MLVMVPNPHCKYLELKLSNALEAYKKRTKEDLCSHPLFAKLEACNTPNTILLMLREQISGFDQSDDDKWAKWLNLTVNVLYNFSAAIGGGISLVSPIVLKVYSFRMISCRYTHQQG